MITATVFFHGKAQTVELSPDVCLPEGMREVDVRTNGNKIAIAPIGRGWDSFFLDGLTVSEDFMAERA